MFRIGVNQIMNIPWRLKSFLFRVIDFFNAFKVLYFLQKYISKRSRLNDFKISPNWVSHRIFLNKYNVTKKVFEFGAGKSLAQNFYLSDIIEKQIVVDLNPMVDFGLVNYVRQQVSEVISLKSLYEIKTLKDLDEYGIEYRAPFNAAQTEFQDKTFDACISTNTLEHIPKNSILSIVKELHRILKDGGVVSARIDYSDHYAHTDSSISLLNFLKFNDNEWSKHNHKIHFQNRLRHYEYIEIFNKIGFEVVEEELTYGANNIPAKVLETFAEENDTWKATAAHIVFIKAKK